MDLFIILSIILGVLLVLVLVPTIICFLMAFHTTDKQKKTTAEYPLPPGEIYEPYHEKMRNWMDEAHAAKSEAVSIQTEDGLTLRGKYYEKTPGAPIEILFPGYRGDADRDMCGGMQRCFALGHNALIVDQRACGKSDGHVITFGIKEHIDCLNWVDFLVGRFGPDVRIILTGVSMGAATVMMAAGEPLPDNVIGVLADCGYTSPKEIICKVMRGMHLPPKLMYPYVKLAARIFGGFNVDENSPLEAVTRSRVPIIFIHGDADDFVPCDMSLRNYEACKSAKKMVVIPGAGHGLCYPSAPDLYLEELRKFFP